MQTTLFKITQLCFILLLCISSANAQYLTTPPNGGNKKASVTERVGITDITINYHRPGVKGREGKVWGQLVPYGFTYLGFGPSKNAPWRAGANENTTITFANEVKIEGKNLSAGTYGFHIAIGEKECTLIFSKNSTAWGSYFYQESEDALRVTVKQEMQDKSTEWLKYEFINQTDNSATIGLFWEKWLIPFKVEVDVPSVVIASMRKELQGEKGFVWESWNQAADYCLQNETNLPEALQWAEAAVSSPFIGEKNFITLSTKAKILKKMNKSSESDATMKQAMPFGNAHELDAYGRELLGEKRPQDALNVFKLNVEKHKGAWPTNVGMTRAYSALGDYANAIKYAKIALPQAPNPAEKTNLENMIKMLQDKKDVN